MANSSTVQIDTEWRQYRRRRLRPGIDRLRRCVFCVPGFGSVHNLVWVEKQFHAEKLVD